MGQALEQRHILPHWIYDHEISMFPLLWCILCKQLGTLWPEGYIHLFTHYTASLLSLYRFNWKYWTCKMLVRYILLSVCLRLSYFFQVCFMYYLYVSSLTIHLSMIVRIFAFHLTTFIELWIWIINYCSGLGHETMVCVLCVFLCVFIEIVCIMMGYCSVTWSHGHVAPAVQLMRNPFHQGFMSSLSKIWETKTCYYLKVNWQIRSQFCTCMTAELSWHVQN